VGYWPLSFACYNKKKESNFTADMVFGMLSMLDQATIKELALNVSMPVQEVFFRFGKLYIRNEVKECLLNHTATCERMPGLPSWCPHFASPEETLPIGTRWLGHLEEKSEHNAQMPCAGSRKSGKWAHPRSKLWVFRRIANPFFGNDPNRHLYNTDNPRQIVLVPGSDSILASGITVDCNPSVDLPDFLSQHSMRKTLYGTKIA
jgi:hypothetical protein